MSRLQIAAEVVWHELECGGYDADLPLWRWLAATVPGPVLDVGAGTGRVALDLARRGHEVIALDRDGLLLEELERRSAGLAVWVVQADARAFRLERPAGLCLVPMQTLQLLGGEAGRRQFLRSARGALRPGGRLAAAIVTEVEAFAPLPGLPLPLADVCEREGVVFWSQPTAVRPEAEHFLLERRREIVGPGGERSAEANLIRLDRLTAAQLEREAGAAGWRPAGRERIEASGEYVGSEVVILDG